MTQEKEEKKIRGLWVDDDGDFLEKVHECFLRYPSYDLHPIRDPYAVDHIARQFKPHFIVFDLRWKESPGRDWHDDEAIGFSIINQIKSAFPDKRLIMGFVVSDLLVFPTNKDKLDSIDIIKETYDKRNFASNPKVLCDDIRSRVDKHLGELYGFRESYFEWSSVCASLSGSMLGFVGDQIQRNKAYRGGLSPTLWKRSLDDMMDLIIHKFNMCLEDWYSHEEQDQAALEREVEFLFNYGHSKTYSHGRFLYLLRYLISNARERGGGLLSETEAMAIKRVVEYLRENDDLSDVEQKDIRKLFALFARPDKVYRGYINSIEGDRVKVTIRGFSRGILKADISKSMFPRRELFPEMEFDLEIRRIEGKLVVTPLLISPSYIETDESTLPRVPKEFQEEE